MPLPKRRRPVPCLKSPATPAPAQIMASVGSKDRCLAAPFTDIETSCFRGPRLTPMRTRQTRYPYCHTTRRQRLLIITTLQPALQQSLWWLRQWLRSGLNATKLFRITVADWITSWFFRAVATSSVNKRWHQFGTHHSWSLLLKISPLRTARF